MTTDRFVRQADLVPHERLQALTAAVDAWWPALAHRLLGRLALLPPTSVTH
jgi:hypothetical protein